MTRDRTIRPLRQPGGVPTGRRSKSPSSHVFGSSAALNVLARRHRRSSSLELLRTKRSIIFLVSSPKHSTSGWPGYDYWPDWGWGGGWGYGRFPSSRGSHGFARFHGFRHFGHFPGGVSAPSRARLKNHRDPIRSHRNGDMSPARQSVRLPSRRVRRRQRSVTT